MTACAGEPCMLPLDEYQTQVSSWLLSTEGQSTPALHPSIARRQAALCVHRNTVLHALVNALRAAFPTVAKLIREDCFAHVARRYARQPPPATPVLYEYGASFPEYLRLAIPDAPYLFDIARFDLLIDQASHLPPALFGRPMAIA